MAVPRDADDWEAVDSLEDFSAFLKLLSEDFETSHADGESSTWAHADAGAFLESFSAWISDSYLNPGALFAELRPEPSWREFARMFCITRTYE